jgi:hypothetical protein
MISAQHSGLTCVPEETVPIPNFTLLYLRHVEHADAEANIVEDAIRIFLVQLVVEGLFRGSAELRGMYRSHILLCEKQLRVLQCEKGQLELMPCSTAPGR